MSKLTVDQIGKNGGTTIDLPTSGKWPQGNIADNAIGASQMADDAVTIAKLAATGTASATTFLRGDNAWVALSTDANTTTKGLYEHAHTISANYSITSGNNAITAGPITINTGIAVTVPTGSAWVIV